METSLKRVRKHRCKKSLRKRQKFELSEENVELSTTNVYSANALINEINGNVNLHECSEAEFNNADYEQSDGEIYDLPQNNNIHFNDADSDKTDHEQSYSDIHPLHQNNDVELNNIDSEHSDGDIYSDNVMGNSPSEQSFSDDEIHDEFENHARLDEISQLRIWAVECKIPKKHLDSLLKILKAKVLPDLPKCSKTFLNTCKSLYTIETMVGSNDSPGEYTYLGIQIGLKYCVNVNMHEDEVLKLDFNVDGVKIKKSSSKTLWPILCRVFHETSPSSYKPFTVALFYGKAKSYITHTRGHTSFHGCCKCNVVARKENSTTVYLIIGEKRTNADFRAFEDPDHHNGISPLLSIEPEVDFINQFVIDPMHLVYLGVNSRMFDQWMNGDKV
uniref:Uncharacterized protein n=1 Tax=Trichogramma kaykai TaxID=54128 RepID=A0ABD2W7Y1_9HYME